MLQAFFGVSVSGLSSRLRLRHKYDDGVVAHGFWLNGFLLMDSVAILYSVILSTLALSFRYHQDRRWGVGCVLGLRHRERFGRAPLAKAAATMHACSGGSIGGCCEAVSL